MTPERAVVAVFAATVNVTTAFPRFCGPLVIVMNVADVVTCQPQVSGAVTDTLPVLAVAGTETLAGENVTHATPASWPTVIATPAIVTMPERNCPGFAVTVIVTDP